MDKFLKIGFSVFALAAVIFGFVRLSNSLHLSFNEAGSPGAAASEQLLEETKQRITDTDTDSISDWEELNTYGTSPYLKDSDSDGASDADEIKAGTDPNCPQGKICGTSDLPAVPPVTPGNEAATSANEAVTPNLEDLNNLTPDEIRAVLKQGGATDEQLQNASDADLKNLLDEVIKSAP